MKKVQFKRKKEDVVAWKICFHFLLNNTKTWKISVMTERLNTWPFFKKNVQIIYLLMTKLEKQWKQLANNKPIIEFDKQLNDTVESEIQNNKNT